MRRHRRGEAVTAPQLLRACFLCLLAACQPTVSPPASEVVVTPDMAGREVHLAMGQTVAVRLNYQPGTGYSWVLLESDTSLTQALESSVSRPDSPALLAGGFETQEFRFKAIESGVARLGVQLVRPREKGV